MVGARAEFINSVSGGLGRKVFRGEFGWAAIEFYSPPGRPSAKMVGARAGFINSVRLRRGGFETIFSLREPWTGFGNFKFRSGGFETIFSSLREPWAAFGSFRLRLGGFETKNFLRCASHGQGLGALQKATPLRCRAPLGEISCAKGLVGGFETQKFFAARAMDRFGSFTESNAAAQGKWAKRAGLLGKARPFYYHYCACRSPVMSS